MASVYLNHQASIELLSNPRVLTETWLLTGFLTLNAYVLPVLQGEAALSGSPVQRANGESE